MIRLRLWLARLLLPRGWVVAPQAYLSYTTEKFAFGSWPHGTVLCTTTVKVPHADTLTQEQMDRKEPEKS